MTVLSIFHSEKSENPSFAFFTKLVKHYQRSRTISTLRSLSNEQLRDIGVERANISTYVNINVK